MIFRSLLSSSDGRNSRSCRSGRAAHQGNGGAVIFLVLTPAGPFASIGAALSYFLILSETPGGVLCVSSDRPQNLALPGNPRYQPKELAGIFGYDNLYRSVVEVEIATMRTLGDIGVIAPGDMALLTDDVEAALLGITTTEVDAIERAVTQHDIRALVRRMQELLPPPLQRWAHLPNTSYDVLDTGRILQFLWAHQAVLRPAIEKVVRIFICFRYIHMAD